MLGLDLSVVARIKLPWPAARAIAVSSNGATAYITHYITAEPSLDAHVSVVDLGQKSVAKVLDIPPDEMTCETQNSGQGVFNLISAVALMPDGAPAEVANQLWVGGEQENAISKGLFKRESSFAAEAGSSMFPWVEYKPFPDAGNIRNVYKSSFHDIIRFGIYKVDLGSGNVVGKVDVDEANNATDIEFSPDGTVAYVVDLMFNSYHIFNTLRGQGGDPTTVFAAVSSNGPGGADPTKGCISEALRSVTERGALPHGAAVADHDDRRLRPDRHELQRREHGRRVRRRHLPVDRRLGDEAAYPTASARRRSACACRPTARPCTWRTTWRATCCRSRPRRRSTRPAIRRTSAARRSRPSRAVATTTVRRARASATIPAAGCAPPTPTAARPCRASSSRTACR